MTDIGKKPNITLAQFCDEYYEKDTSIIVVICPRIKFKPNGWFHEVRWSASLENNPENDYKDSLAITVGKCSKVN